MATYEFDCEWCGENTGTYVAGLTICDECAACTTICGWCSERVHNDHMDTEEHCFKCYPAARAVAQEIADDKRYARKPAALWGFL